MCYIICTVEHAFENFFFPKIMNESLTMAKSLESSRKKKKTKNLTHRKRIHQRVKHTNFEHTYVLASLNLQTAKQMFFFFFFKLSDLPSFNLEYICTLKSE